MKPRPPHVTFKIRGCFTFDQLTDIVLVLPFGGSEPTMERLNVITAFDRRGSSDSSWCTEVDAIVMT